jgi:hypothetical protein
MKPSVNFSLGQLLRDRRHFPLIGRGLGTNFINLGTLLEIPTNLGKTAKPLLYSERSRVKAKRQKSLETSAVQRKRR